MWAGLMFRVMDLVYSDGAASSPSSNISQTTVVTFKIARVASRGCGAPGPSCAAIPKSPDWHLWHQALPFTGLEMRSLGFRGFGT